MRAATLLSLCLFCACGRNALPVRAPDHGPPPDLRPLPADLSLELVPRDRAVDVPNPPPPLLTCTEDQVAPPGAQGKRPLRVGYDVVPLCDGWVYVSDREAKHVQLLNVFTGEVRQTYALPAGGGFLTLDAEAALLYVTLYQPEEMAQDLARIDLKSGQVGTVKLGMPAASAALLDDGFVFVYLYDNHGTPPEVYAILDRAGSVRTTIEVPWQDWLFNGLPVVAWSPLLKRLYLGTLGSVKLVKASVDTQALTVSLEQETPVPGTGIDLRISADGKHLLHAMMEQSLPVWDPKDLTAPPSEWSAIYYPSGVDFNADGSRVAVADVDKDHQFESRVAVYRASDRKLLAGPVWLQLPQTRLRFSRGGRILFSVDRPTGTNALHWWVPPLAP